MKADKDLTVGIGGNASVRQNKRKEITAERYFSLVDDASA